MTGKEFVKFQLARSFFNQKEYLRASYYLTDCESSSEYFLYIYSKYMVKMKYFNILRILI